MPATAVAACLQLWDANSANMQTTWRCTQQGDLGCFGSCGSTEAAVPPRTGQVPARVFQNYLGYDHWLSRPELTVRLYYGKHHKPMFSCQQGGVDDRSVTIECSCITKSSCQREAY